MFERILGAASIGVQYVPRVKFRWLITRDIPQIVDLDAIAFPHDRWGREDYEARLRQKFVYGKVAEIPVVQEYGHDWNVVGFVVYSAIVQTPVMVQRMAVRPDRRRQRVGSAIVDHLLQCARDFKRESIWCDVDETNLAGQLLLRSRGFDLSRTLREGSEERDALGVRRDAYRFVKEVGGRK